MFVSDLALPGGTFALSDDLEVTRFGYGAMQLSGPNVLGPPRDPDEAVRVLREVVALGITHIDTSDAYGPHSVNLLIRDALSPYPDSLHVVTKVGARRGDDGSWPKARSTREITDAVHTNLRHLGRERLDTVNLRLGSPLGPEHGSVEEPLSALIRLQEEGLIGHLGMSNVTREQVREARAMTRIVCVQNFYNLAHRDDDDLIDELARDGIAFVPFFPLGGYSPLQSADLMTVATRLGVAPLGVALAWLLRRSPNILLIPGTSSRAHLHENLAGARVDLSIEDLALLDDIGTADAASAS